ncbi:unnamed protein product [Cuscuta campestris]|uniref:CCHC-type domain-containing protein n=1 Tax=Cuscuta campestris TaxID=132261 RepID=A0A484MG33_9ASTE|nr:unnamed protein product [Cuscuta campestris]
MMNNMDHGLPKFSLLGYDDWKIMLEAHLYALHDCMWMVLEDGPLKIQMENLEWNPTNPDVVKYIPKPKEKWDDRDCKKHNLDNVANAAIFKTLDPITFSKIKHLKAVMEIWQGLGKLCEGSEDLRKQKIKPPSSKTEDYEEEFAIMVKQFRKFKKFFKKADSVRRPSKGKLQVSDSPPESYLCYNCRKPGHWKSACPYPKVEKYGKRERNEKKKKAMVAAKSDESSSSSSDEEALVCMERRAEKSNHEDRWTMSEDDTLCIMAKDDADQEVTSQTSCSSSYESIPTSENLFDKFKKMMEDFEEINFKHSSLSEENKLLSEENLKLTEDRKSQLSEITQLKAENESLFEKVKYLNKKLGILKSKEGVDKILETTKHKGREGLGFDPSSSKRKGRKTFIPPKPTAKTNEQKGHTMHNLDSGCSRHMTGDASLLSNLIPYDGPRVTFGGSNDFGLTKGLGNLVYKGLTIQAVSYVEGLNYNLLSISQFCDKGYSLEFCKDMASLKNISTNEVILTGKRIRNIYEVMWDDVKEACLISKDKDVEVNEGDRMKPMEFIPFGSLPLKTLQRNPNSDSAEPTGNHGQPSEIPDLSHGDNSGSDDITQERTFIINALITRTKVNWAKHFFNSVSKHLGKPKQKYLCQGLYLGYILESLGVASEDKKYDARYWLYYLSFKGENSASSTAEDEGSSDNVLIDNPQKVDEGTPQDQSPPSPSSQARTDEVSKFLQLYYVWKAWKVGNSADQLLEWDQQLKNEKVIKRCLGLPVNCHCERILDEEWAENITAEAQADMEAEVEDFQVFLETSLVFDAILTEAVQGNAVTPQRDQETYEEEVLKSLQFQSIDNLEKSTPPKDTEEEAHKEPAIEALRSFKEAEEGAQIVRLKATETPVAIFEQQTEDATRDSLSRDISNYGNADTKEESVKTLRIDEKEADSSKSTFPDEMPEPWTRKVQGLIESALEAWKASFRQDLEKVEMRHSQILEKNEEKYSSNLKEISQSVNKTLEIISLLSKSASNTMMAYASDCHLQLKEAMEIKQQIASVTTSLQKQMSFLQMDIRPALAVSSENQVVTQDYLKVLADNQKEAFKRFKHFGTFTAKHKLDVTVQYNSLPPIPRLPIEVKQGKLAKIPTHVNMTELILEARQSNLENSIQHLSNIEFDGTEAIGTIASHFTNDAQTKERYNNLKRIKEECGVMQGIGEAAGSSKRKKN